MSSSSFTNQNLSEGTKQYLKKLNDLTIIIILWRMNHLIIMPAARCFSCHVEIEKFTGVNVARLPKKGHITLCMNCGAVSQFDADLNLVPLTAAELQELQIKYPKSYAALKQNQSEIAQKIKLN